MSDEQREAPFRLAIRAEGKLINAYVAPMDTMEDATLIASISRSLCDTDPELFTRWRQLLQRPVGKLFEELFGVRPEWGDPETAPEHERAGRG